MSDDILVRIPLSGASQFHPLALAPGLPMLDARKLTYQVLLGWFGDVLAEPELNDDGVLFHAQAGGRRQPIVEKALATTADLNGPLVGEFEKLKKALFEVRPVSPSERLIFNRLQPPIGNHDGYLYRIQSGAGDPRLVWCWGFQKRSSDAPAMICSSPDCSLLFLQKDASVKICPRCEEPLSPKISMPNRRSMFPVGAFAATVILGGLAAATYWFPVLTGAEEANGLPEFSGGELGETSTGTTVAGDGQATGETKAVDATSEGDPNKPPVRSETKPGASATGQDGSAGTVLIPLPLPGETKPETVKPDDGSSAPIVKLPKPDPAGPRGPESLQNGVTGTGEPDSTSPEVKPEPEKPRSLGNLSWHTDYMPGYEAAANSRRRLVMLFLGSNENPEVNSRGGFESPELEALLGDVVRLQLPVDVKVAGGAEPLLAHRSFRHLGLKPGFVIIDLTDPQSPLYGQVVSAMSLPAGNQFPLEPLKKMLALPTGSIGQRSLLLAIRSASESAESDSPLLNAKPHPTVSDLANRNARFMAHFGRDDLYEAPHRGEVLKRTFGENTEARELTFATTEATSVQTAAVQAVQAWTRREESAAILAEPASVYGLDLFQSPENGRWFATLILVK
jgi:hypothetical protein